jgi:hypothetical protein
MHYQESLRAYLESKKIRVKAGSPDSQLPCSVSDDTINRFERKEEFPNIENPKIDWMSSLSGSEWNRQLLAMLVNDFRNQVINREIIVPGFDANQIDAAYLFEKCIRTLRTTQERVKKGAELEKKLADTRDTYDRETLKKSYKAQPALKSAKCRHSIRRTRVR